MRLLSRPAGFIRVLENCHEDDTKLAKMDGVLAAGDGPMFQHRFDMTTATPVDAIERHIVQGLAECKSVHQIAQDIVHSLRETSDNTVQNKAD